MRTETIRPLVQLSKGNKYNARKVEIDGITFDSIKESQFYLRLKTLKHAHDLSERVTLIIPQYPIDVYIKTKHVFTYICDFKVSYASGSWKYFDVKGMKAGAAYAMFRLKKKCCEAQEDIEIIEI